MVDKSSPWASAPVIKTPRLVLRPFTHETLQTPDIDDIFEIRNSKSVMHWTRSGQVDGNVDVTKAWLQDSLERPHECIKYAVELPFQGSNSDIPNDGVSGRKSKIIGIMGSNHVPEVGYLMHEDYHGKGYATEAMKGYLEVYWQLVPQENAPSTQSATTTQAGLDRVAAFDYIHANVDSENTGSIRVLEKAGFKLWGSAISNICVALGPDRTDLYFRQPRPGTVLQAKPVSTDYKVKS